MLLGQIKIIYWILDPIWRPRRSSWRCFWRRLTRSWRTWSWHWTSSRRRTGLLFLFDTSLSVLFLKELGYPGAARPSFLNGCLIKKKKKSFLRIINFFRGLSKFNENLKFWRQFFEILSIYKPSLGSFAVTHNLWARSVQPFERLLDKNKLR